MSRRRLVRDICEALEDSGYLADPDDLPVCIARALDEAWRNGYSIGFDERDVVPDATEVRRLISEADAVSQKLTSVIRELGDVAFGCDVD